MRLGWGPGYEAERVECPVSPFLIWPWNMMTYVLKGYGINFWSLLSPADVRSELQLAISQLFTSQVAVVALGAAFRETCLSRLQLCRDVLVLLCVVQEGGWRVSVCVCVCVWWHMYVSVGQYCILSLFDYCYHNYPGN